MAIIPNIPANTTPAAVVTFVFDIFVIGNTAIDYLSNRG
jgi:hypothetical protein